MRTGSILPTSATHTLLVIATRNRGKCRELAAYLRRPGLLIRSLRAFPRALRVVEDGHTFAANARKKALAIARATGHLAIGDDSGLRVDALHGAPGVRSARFAGPSATDEQNNAKLLRVLRGVPASRRGAAFHCALAVADPAGWVCVVEGRCAGTIAEAPRGRHGFGYDPLFILPRYGRTFGELGARYKARWSHRAQAARRARLIVAEYLRVRGAHPARGRKSRPARVRAAARVGT